MMHMPFLAQDSSVLTLMGSLLSTVYAFTHAHVVQEESTISSLQPKTTGYKCTVFERVHVVGSIG